MAQHQASNNSEMQIQRQMLISILHSPKTVRLPSYLKAMSKFLQNILRQKCLRLPSFYLVGNWTLDSLRAKMGHKTELKFAPYEIQLGSKTEKRPGNVENLSLLLEIWNMGFIVDIKHQLYYICSNCTMNMLHGSRQELFYIELFNLNIKDESN